MPEGVLVHEHATKLGLRLACYPSFNAVAHLVYMETASSYSPAVSAAFPLAFHWTAPGCRVRGRATRAKDDKATSTQIKHELLVPSFARTHTDVMP